jgi:hypothetical protein
VHVTFEIADQEYEIGYSVSRGLRATFTSPGEPWEIDIESVRLDGELIADPDEMLENAIRDKLADHLDYLASEGADRAD